MRALFPSFLFASVGFVLACSDVASLAGPQQCSACAGTGQVTRSFEAPLPGRVDCTSQSEETGFLGLGEGVVHVTAAAYNDGDEGGQFAVEVKAGLPGQSTDAAVSLKSTSVWIDAHGVSQQTYDFTPAQLQNLSVLCSVKAPTTVQQTKEVCPVCKGAGMI